MTVLKFILADSTIAEWTKFAFTIITVLTAASVAAYKFLDVFRQALAAMVQTMEALHKIGSTASAADAKADALMQANNNNRADLRALNAQMTAVAQAQVPATPAPATVSPPPTIEATPILRPEDFEVDIKPETAPLRVQT